ncbi:MAG: hypothetical protein KatS3mg103_1309 [Phycisphaerales bacterium]|nr:MAG: hypothetical protein KatS3mg103_1309 [Phycisphaerales bacterium]
MHDLLIILPRVATLLFVLAFGACVGSLINVLVYRLPRGIGVVTPPSRCPACHTRLRWKDNIPIIVWVLLRGRCRYCKAPISPEYPLVELLCASLFGLFYVLWYLLPAASGPVEVLGIDLASLAPDWAAVDRFSGVPTTSAPMLLVVLVLVGALLTMTLTDLKTTLIPLVLPWFATLAGVIVHTGYAAYLWAKGLEYPMPGAEATWRWAIPTHGWSGLGLGLGGVAGIGVSLLLLRLGLIRQSFADAQDWEQAHREQLGLPPIAEQRLDAEHQPDPSQPGQPAQTGQWRPRAGWWRPVVAVVLATAGCGLAGAWIAGLAGVVPAAGLGIGVVLGPIVAGVVLKLLAGGRSGPTDATHPEQAPDDADQPKRTPSDAEVWIHYPHARREMVKEMAFLAMPTVGAWVGMLLAGQAQGLCPLWLDVLGGTLVGYLVGGGVVWMVRLLGSLGFGKEAMGLGDVHLMAAVGACLGWVDAVLAFFAAAFVGIVLTLYGVALSRGVGRAMPYGPALAIATVLVLLFKPAIEAGLTRLTGQPINLP